MNLLPILAIGAVAILMSSQKSSSSSKKKKDENNYDGLVLKGVPSDSKPDNKGKGEILIKGGGCGSLEYLSDGKCHPFWVNIETDNMVYQELKNQIKELNLNTWDLKCAAQQDEEGSYTLENPNRIKVMVRTIAKLWQESGVTKNQLPPKKSDPEWLKTVWLKVNKIYLNQICQIYDTNYEFEV